MQPGLKFEFENADILNNDVKPDYIVECSGEFPKNKHCVEEKSLQYDISPFIKNTSRMSEDGYEKFSRRVQSFIRTANQWNDFKRKIDLAQIGNREYLLQEIREVFPENIKPCMITASLLSHTFRSSCASCFGEVVPLNLDKSARSR